MTQSLKPTRPGYG